VPRLIVVQDAAFRQRFAALGTAFGVLVLVAIRAVEDAVFWNEGTRSYRFLTDDAFKALFVPIGAIVLETRAPWFYVVPASFAHLLKVVGVAITAQDLILVEGEFSI